ncbi:Peptidase S8, subtilisin-related [Parasponia andersonii]|uniref:Peptidase S8, subtilisin-related n=1 Tax=Parasponia andersonii TaxID=3476 RepID=A0A2P5C8R6_PARAD|nr:Peptidase S8, subtilisin-related [Parasponia andersonii]
MAATSFFSLIFVLNFFRVIALQNEVLSVSQTIETSDLQNYIIQVQQPKGRVLSQSDDLESWYKSFLPAGTAASSDNQPRILYSYRNVMSGFAARLTQAQVRAMAGKDGFVSARPERILKKLTTRTPNFLGLHQQAGFWRESNFGKGVIIGVLDGGVFPSHPSFSDAGIPPPPTKWKGRSFNLAAKATKGGTTEPPIDEDGHGTHTASTAAGGFVNYADVLGNAKGTAAGMAPYAHLAIYKVCFGEDCPDSDILAALAEDGVDVLSLSLGVESTPFFNDSIAVGSFAAIQKRIFLSCSAGNSGPFNGNLSNEAPWTLMVGASTIDRKIVATAKLGNGQEFDGETVHRGDFPPMYSPLVYAGVNGKSESAFCAEGSLKEADAHVLPAVHVSFVDGLKIKAYINSTATPTATILFKGTVTGDLFSPAVASFSSRGPSLASPGILKPDIIGPLCIKSSHPYWSSAAIKSAIMTTADVVNFKGKAIFDETLEPADIFATGSGHVNPTRANDPGLVYDLQPDDYIPYLCGLGYKDEEVGIIVHRPIKCSEELSIPEGALNYPSFSVTLGPSQTFTRTVTNVGEAYSSYTVKIVAPDGVYVSVEPNKLYISKVNQKATFSVTFSSIASSVKIGAYGQGFLIWVSDKYYVRSPISIKFQ